MGKRRALLLLVCCTLVAFVSGFGWTERGEEDIEIGSRRDRGNRFILHNSKQVVKTDAGEMRVLRGYGGRFVENPMHIGIINMQPRSLFIPQYLDSSLIIFIQRGEARIGSIYKDKLVEQRLSNGDIYRVEAGSAFYLENTDESQNLRCICSIDSSESLNWHAFQSFYLGGGRYPSSVLSGFESDTLSMAFNISSGELKQIMNTQKSGAIVSLNPDSNPPNEWTRFVQQEHHQRRAHLKRIVQLCATEKSKQKEDFMEDEEEQRAKWSLRKLLFSIFGQEEEESTSGYNGRGSRRSESYNLYNRKPNFENNFGWSLSVDGSDYSPLHHSGVSVYLVNLTAGAMMAPHINPTATEYGIVLRGTGNIQIVFPNGTQAMNARVSQGDVFWVPRYFPFCQIASRDGPFEFFGFTTSSHRNRPQFLVGENSLMQNMMGPEFAAAFGVSERRLKNLVNAQRESTILPPNDSSPEEDEEEWDKGEKIIPKLIKEFGN